MRMMNLSVLHSQESKVRYFLSFGIMNKQQKLDAIYEAMADKTLSRWCMIEFTYREWALTEYWWDEDAWWESSSIEYVKWDYTDWDFSFPTDEIKDWLDKDSEMFIKIIWHPVRIGDVLEYIKYSDSTLSYIQSCIALLLEWWEPSMTINEQSDDCIAYVYSLISE